MVDGAASKRSANRRHRHTGAQWEERAMERRADELGNTKEQRRRRHVPLELLFNRWRITPSTNIAMPLDTHQTLHDPQASYDSHGKLMLNTGLIIAQALPLTLAMLSAWVECPTQTRYEGCAQWKQKWAHEQRVFFEYIRYDFNPNGSNIVEIPCNDAMGYPGLETHDWVKSKRMGRFLRNHTVDKGRTKKSAEEAMLQSLTDLLHTELHGEKKAEYMVKEGEGEGTGKAG
ncbi:hypothetical protein BDW02DRAFT_566975 [Decorospora gaudefroyi]|uniref:Uncharacterized protein n=1 Tax=Decorospora gaudefroyi TaxID=184978 RepID=A0A6A5KMW4_9PLEO|nr:hypothetical protein BDW02DRAFT_566975 [Decorospora gaudefroyi]